MAMPHLDAGDRAAVFVSRVRATAARYPELAGVDDVMGCVMIGASTAASFWGPPSWKGPGNVAENASISFASTAALTVVREFLPDILRRRRK
jgi:hypothetical protein